ncbi:MAG TPA: carboxypeptidase regulatory-like domain-containing protein, partial [Planctomycetota bacterium]|nr:carboxypeptidase regulatory-like domain-containing protein [Planctomycetota bacterium]
ARVSVNMWGGNGGESASYGRGVSGEDGAYEVKGLQPGHFSGIQVRRDGYLDFPDSRRGMMTSEQLGAGAAVERDARLRKGAALVGRVADAKGTPVAGARVVATSFVPSRGMDYSPPVLTAEDGSFRLENLPSGMTLLRVHAEGCAQADYPSNEWEALQTGPAPESCSVKVPEEGEARKDLVVVRGGSVSGAVADRDGKPVPGLQVTVSASKNSVGGGTGTTDAEGNFRLEGVAPGDGLKVSAFGPKGVHGTSDEFSVAEAASVDGIRVAVTLGGSIAGRLSRADGGTLAEADLRLVQGAIDPDQPWNWDWQKRSAGSHPVAADGSFRIDGLREGKYTLLGDAPGAAEATSAAVELAAGEAKEGVDLVLGEEKAIAGRVVNEAGEPVVGARISAAKATNQNIYWGGGGQGTVAAVTGADGAFTIGGTGDSSYKVTASAPGLSLESVTVKGGARDVLLTLKAGGTISGLVVDESTGEPIAELTVHAQPMVYTQDSMHMQSTARTGKDGRFTLRDLKPVDWNVTAGQSWGSEGEHVPKTVPNVKVGTADLRVAVARGVAISGSLVDGDGKPVSGQFGINAVGVDAEGDQDGSRQRWTQTDGDGTFRIPGLKPGNYDLQVNNWGGAGGEGWAPAARKGVVAGTEGVTIVMRRGAAITGKVLDEEGKPWSKEGYLTVTLSGETGPNQHSWGQIQEDGTFATQPLESGKTYDLTVQGNTAGLLVGARGVPAGSKDVVVRATKGGSLSGMVTDEEGKPVAKCPVTARAEGLGPQTAGAQAWGQTGDDGKFTISGLVDAKYKVTGGGSNSDWMGTTLAEPFSAGSEGLVIKVKKGLVLSGRLVDASGNPVKPQALSLIPEGGDDDDSLWGSVAEDGAFTFKGLAAAKYRVRAWMGDGWKECGTFEAPAAGVTATVP